MIPVGSRRFLWALEETMRIPHHFWRPALVAGAFAHPDTHSLPFLVITNSGVLQDLDPMGFGFSKEPSRQEPHRLDQIHGRRNPTPAPGTFCLFSWRLGLCRLKGRPTGFSQASLPEFLGFNVFEKISLVLKSGSEGGHFHKGPKMAPWQMEPRSKTCVTLVL